MEITSFILGVCAVIVLMMVVGTFVNYMTTKSLKKEINTLQRQLEYTLLDMEKKESQLYTFGNDLNQNRVDEEEKLYRHIDSRVDKVVDNVSREIAYLNQMVDKLQNDKSVING
jgi:predicted Holliday junction resolvase-like endonuclease